MKGRNRKRAGLVGNMLLFLACLLALGLFLDNRLIRTTRVTLEEENLPQAFEGTRIVHLSDLHNARFGNGQERLRKAIEAQNPDLVVMTGDLVSSGDTDIQASLDLMEQLALRYETLFSMGNHEQIRIWLGKDGVGGIGARLSERGVHVLDNSFYEWNRGSDRIRIAGYTAELYEFADRDGKLSAGVSERDPAPLYKSLGMPDKGVDLLLAHNPDYLPRYAAWGAEIVLSGHLHGGVIRIPGVGGMLSPSHEWFPQYDAGLYVSDDTQLFVNRGLGNSVIPVRVFNPPEIVVVTLKSAE